MSLAADGGEIHGTNTKNVMKNANILKVSACKQG